VPAAGATTVTATPGSAAGRSRATPTAAARVALVVALLMAALAPASTAQAGPCDIVSQLPGCSDETPPDGPGGPGGPGNDSGGGGFACDPACTHIETTSAQLPAPGDCFQIVQGGPGHPTYAEAAAFAAAQTGLPPCPGQHDPAADIGQQWRDSGAIPRPTASIKPGKALTGLPAYLVIETPSQVELELTSDATGITYLLTLETEYTVDWGDGAVDRGIDRNGQPYPGGRDEITHVYDRAELVDVVVTARWRGTWRLAGTHQEQELPGVVERTYTIEDFPVDQIQAVRRR